MYIGATSVRHRFRLLRWLWVITPDGNDSGFPNIGNDWELLVIASCAIGGILILIFVTDMLREQRKNKE